MNTACNQCTTRNCRQCPRAQLRAAWDIARHYHSEGAIINDHPPGTDAAWGIALDVGTTTLAFELFDLNAPAVRAVAAHARINSQRGYGADVITRINRAAEGAAEALHTCLLADIRAGAAHIIKEAGATPDAVRRMAIAGNTTMLHLLHNLPCKTLGMYPFTPVEIGAMPIHFDFLPTCEAVTLPGVSAFVGADVIAGLACLGGAAHGETRLLVDLGTNGELALTHRGKIYTASTAAGPAFEAANISCGVGAVAGAISAVQYDPATGFACETIGGVAPIGLCGTGAVSLAATLVRHELVSAAGRLQPPFSDGVVIAPGITFTQDDLREVQLAKAAVRAGIELLLLSAECTPADISRVYMAGGFGQRLCCDSAATIGLFPGETATRAQAVGNTALGGAVRWLHSRAAAQEITALAAAAQEVNLAAHPRFNDLFMEHIAFSEV